MASAYLHYLETGKIIAEANSTSPLYEISKLFLHRIITGYGPDHYVTYSLFKIPVNVKRWREYVDKRDLCEILFMHNKKTHFKVLEDKVAFARQCCDLQLPHPPIHFTVGYAGGDFVVSDFRGNEIATAFENLSNGDYIVKTCVGSYGINLWSVTKTDKSILVHNDQTQLTAGQFSDRLLASGERYLVQDKIAVARSLRGIMPGGACGSIRVNSFLRSDGSVVIPYVMVKLPVIGPVSDNFVGGDSGNMLAMVDMESQCFTRVLKKFANGLLGEVTHHPDTGIDLRNYHFPELSAALEMGRECALKFPHIPAVGWDIVVTDQGPMVLEGNPMFDPVIPQLCASRGLRSIIPQLLE